MHMRNLEEDNHFVGVFEGSKTLFIDDTLMYYTNLRCLLRSNSLGFHPSLYSNGLSPEAPLLLSVLGVDPETECGVGIHCECTT